ncbi:TonB family protein [Maribacter algicola]|uniref:TonB family protein n=1 Tax=Meishania litoralis TaxID=3434685 RepID=A0ACC7LH31_9FLAO
MIQYMLECIAFQLVFLVIYDFMLKRETFFQWNRAYLIGTYVLSLVLPWVKIEALRSTLPERYFVYPMFLADIDAIGNGSLTEGPRFNISWGETILFGGMFLAAIYFGHKLFQIYRLRKNGEIRYFPNFTRIVIANSQMAFSFFRFIFLGDKVLQREHQSIIRHELVHIEQKHSWDLLFFELMRIIGWFNPLVYVYQQRVSELHEFIADSYVAKTHKKEQYEVLLSQIFQTENISFINQFFKSSLIKKRIVMLQKAKSKKVWQLKYLMLVPLVLGMLVYTSCEQENIRIESPEIGESDLSSKSSTKYLEKYDVFVSYAVGDIKNLTDEEKNLVFSSLVNLSKKPKTWAVQVQDANSNAVRYVHSDDGSYITIDGHDEKISATMMIITESSKDEETVVGIDGNGKMMPFRLVDEPPIFPGCENVNDKTECFQDMMRKHIVQHFKYPQEAQEKGIQGKVYLSFIIDEQGHVTELKKRGPDALLEAEAERIVSLLPKMMPGKHKGELVKVPFSVPITFRLQ